MEIHISIDTREPLTGTATAGGGDHIHFDGWLELLRAISSLLDTRERPEDERSGSSRAHAARRGEGDGNGRNRR